MTRRSKILAFAAGFFVAAPALAGLRFTPVAGPPDALMISNSAVGLYLLPHSFYIPYGLFVSPGRGAFELGRTNFLAVPCTDVQLADQLAFGTYAISTPCGIYAVANGVVTPAGASLPSGTLITAMRYGLVGTSNAGVFSFGTIGSIGDVSFANVLTPASDGLPADAPVRSLGSAGGKACVSLSGGGLFARATSGRWEDASAGLPAGSIVGAVNGYAALDGQGIWRWTGAGGWRRDSHGVSSTAVYGFASSFAVAGTAGVLHRTDGGWQPEPSGLPLGTDARTVDWVPGYTQDDLYVGTNGQGLFHAFTTPVVRILPAIVNTTGATGREFLTEITIGNYGVYLSALGLSLAGSGTHSDVNVAYRTETRAVDAFSWLQAIGLPVTGRGVTSLSAGMSSPSNLARPSGTYMLARVYTTDAAGGTYGVMLEAPTDIDAAEEEASVYGLTSTAGIDRSNLAVVPMPGRGADPVTLSVQVFSADGTPAPNVLTQTLAPGEFFQWNDVLLLAGLPQGSSGYARISRTAGIGAWTGYGVVNDAATSDGAILPLYRPGGLAAARRLLVPVVLDAYGAAGSHYTTELTLANDSAEPSTVSLIYHGASGYGSPLAAPAATVSVGAGRQVTLPDVIAVLRASGVSIPDPLVAGSQVGTLEVVFDGLDGDDTARTVALARTTTPNPNHEIGGRFGVGYSAIAWGGGARQSALVPALSEDASTRSNLAVVNAGGGSEGPITLSVQLRDADTGADTGSPLVVTLSPGEWFQWNRVIALADATTTRAIATVTLVSGDDTFFAYGVLNDAKTSDGSFVRMISLDAE